MKVYSVNFLLKGKTPYKDLAPVFPDILKLLLSTTSARCPKRRRSSRC